MPGWIHDCQTLWGDDWIAPLSEVLAVNRRTIERWREGRGQPRPEIIAELARLAALPNTRAVGRMVRRLANGDTLATITAEIEADREAVATIATQIGTYSTIDALKGRKRD